MATSTDSISVKDSIGASAGDKAADLEIARVRHWLVYVPFKAEIEWGSGKRPGSTRLIVEVTTRSGVVGYGETICLLHFIEPVLVNVVIPLALGRSVADVERLHRHAERTMRQAVRSP